MYIQIGDEIAFHPGEYLKGFIDRKHINVRRLAKETGVDVYCIQGLIDGTQSVTKDFAKAMADRYGFGNEGQFWLNLQEAFDKKVGNGDV